MSPGLAARAAAAVVLALGGAVGAPSPGSAAPATVRFAVKGDWGYGGPAQAAVTRTMCASHRARPFAFVLTTGDNFYRPDGVATADNWTRPERCLIRAGVRWRPAWGNHDVAGDGTARVLGGRRRFYTFASGPLRVVVLDANRPGQAAQTRFLARVLRAAREPVRVVAFHQPAHTAGFHGPSDEIRRRWVPLFRRHGVALVLQGHNHAYERLVVDGVTYVVTGGGGAPVYPCIRPTRALRRCLMIHHHLQAEARPEGIRLRVVDRDGDIRDSVWVPARR